MIGEFLTDTSTVEPRLGSSGRGELFGPPAELPCLIQDQQRLVRSDVGTEQVSATVVFYPAGTDLPVGSRVTIRGRVTTVLSTAVLDDRLTGLAHVEVTLR